MKRLMCRALAGLTVIAVGVGLWTTPAYSQCPSCPPVFPGYGPAYGLQPGGGPPSSPPMNYPACANPNCFQMPPSGGPQGGPGGSGLPGFQGPQQIPSCVPCDQFYHYPFYYFPHNYWPANSPQWPEPKGKCYMPPPAYQAFPPYKAPMWRYEYWEPQRFHRGSHFLLDVF